jgi:glycosyltransferase involved in cell wall biosynthesis
VKIAWYSNAPWAGTGYGQQTDIFTELLAADGHDVAILANYGLNGAPRGWKNMPVYPGGYDMWANDVLSLHSRHHFNESNGLILTLCDVWVIKNPVLKEMPLASWVPIDHTPIPPKVAQFFHEYNAHPIAMSKFGLAELQNLGLDSSYVPHGIDTDVFRPMTEVGGRSVREVLGLPADAFVVGMNAANKGSQKIRKSFPQVFLAFAMFQRKRPDAILYLHTEKFGHSAGVDLIRLAQACGVPEDSIRYTDQYAYRMGLKPELLAAMYSCFDVLASPSMGEGFGIPVVEAQACGVPVIVSDATAQPELCGSGWTVGGVPDWDEAQASWFHLPDVFEIAAAMDEAYEGQGDREKARQFALQYHHTTVYRDYWVPTLERLATMVELPSVDFKVEPVRFDG